jgi:cobalt/nickel transport protein
MFVLVVALASVPLMMIHKPEHRTDGKEVEIFTGSDDQARDAVSEVAPDYKPWAHSWLVPPSGEVESLLFALQAAIGAGFIGYYFGTRRAKSVAEAKA